MLGETLINLPYVPGVDLKSVNLSGGSGLYPVSLGASFGDYFQRDKAPTSQELLSHLVGTAYRCVDLNANLLATSRMRLYVRKAPGEPEAKFVAAARRAGKVVTRAVPKHVVNAWKFAKRVSNSVKSALMDAVEDSNDIEEVTEHPLLDLLRKPEDAMQDGGLVPYDHRYVTQALLEVLGRSYYYIGERDAFGRPKRLAMLRAQLVVEVPDPAGQVPILKYRYGTQTFPVEDVIRFAIPDPSNMHLSVLSPMRAAIEVIRLQRGGHAFTDALLQNGGYPAGVWTPKGDSEGGGIGRDEARRMQSTFRTAFSMNQAGRIFVSEYPGTLQSIAFKPAEIIDVERARELAGEIADCFSVPRTKLFRDTSNRAAGESGDMDHAKDAGLSRCSRYEETLNSQLIPLYDPSGKLFVAFDSPLPRERTLVLDETRTGGQLGLTDINEGREALGLEPYGDDNDLGKCRVLSDRNILVNPDGSFYGDAGAEIPANAEATLNPPKDPNQKPPADKPKPKKGMAAALRLLTRQLVKSDRERQKLVELLEAKGSDGLQRTGTDPTLVLLPVSAERAPSNGEILPDVRGIVSGHSGNGGTTTHRHRGQGNGVEENDSSTQRGSEAHVHDAADEQRRSKVIEKLIAANYSPEDAERLVKARACEGKAEL